MGSQVEKELAEVPAGRVKFGSEWFRRVVRRIEYIKPVQKKERAVITVKPLPEGGGHVIDLVTGSALTVSLTSITNYSLNPVTITVCSGGESVTLTLAEILSANSVTVLTCDDKRASVTLLVQPDLT